MLENDTPIEEESKKKKKKERFGSKITEIKLDEEQTTF